MDVQPCATPLWMEDMPSPSLAGKLVHAIWVGVPSDRIRIRYCLYHIRIRTQPSHTDTNIDGCEKMISVSVKIGYQIWIEY